ncbi:hypothetical protein E2C01_013559 [Portunus trituberculatus]|uniref:Uncharacterized protein n=1 Tax=Portunus trituberculatus TaxID=210409 RepID=A0A5B7DHL5_PORTR|nr:hypothetical protein [Portunus trituberculatus]
MAGYVIRGTHDDPLDSRKTVYGVWKGAEVRCLRARIETEGARAAPFFFFFCVPQLSTESRMKSVGETMAVFLHHGHGECDQAVHINTDQDVT